MVLADDTGLMDRPDSGGWVVLVPVSSHPWKPLGLPKPERANPAVLAHAGFAVDPAAVEQMGGELVPVDEDGTFSTKATGGQLLCRLRGTSRQAGAAGCVIVELPVQGGLRLIFGEGGLRVEEG